MCGRPLLQIQYNEIYGLNLQVALYYITVLEVVTVMEWELLKSA